MESEYERQRADNIQRNQQILAQLNIGPLRQHVVSPSWWAGGGVKRPTRAHKRKRATRDAALHGVAESGSTPRRRSLRVRGLNPEGRATATAASSSSAATEDESAQATYPAPSRKLDDESLVDIACTAYGASAPEAADGDDEDVDDNGGENKLASRMRDVSNRIESAGAGAGERRTRLPDMSAWSIDSERGFYKLTPARSYSAAILPLRDLPVGALGDKSGRVGVFAVGASDSDEGGDAGVRDGRGAARSSVFAVEAHTRPVTSLLPRNRHQLLTGSYDATVRCVDLHAQRVTTLMAERNEQCCFSSCVADPSNEHVLYVSSIRGDLYRMDTRQRRERYDVFDVHDLKLFNVDVAPDRSECLLVSTKNAGVFVLDARRLDAAAASSVTATAATRVTTRRGHQSRQEQTYARQEGERHRAVVHVLPHARAVCSARWSPVGQRILTTCYDNYLRVWNASGDSSTPSVEAAFAHNNNTGRWVKHFAAEWDPTTRHERFVCGSMSGSPHGMDVFDTRLEQQREAYRIGGDVMTAIAPVHAFHPDGTAMIGGTGSGRAYVWRDWRSW